MNNLENEPSVIESERISNDVPEVNQSKSWSKRLMGIGAAVAIGGLVIGLTSCATEAEAPADLIGDWMQTNSESEDSYQTATITANEIRVFMVGNGGDSKSLHWSLYWAGTYEAPVKSGSFVWDSENDTFLTDGSLLGSGASTKTFTFEGDEISYEVTMLGTTTTVRLERDE